MSSAVDLLIERGLVSAADLDRAQEMCVRIGGWLPATLVRLGMVGEAELAGALSEAADVPLLPREQFPSELPQIEGLNHHFLARHAVLPLNLADGRLTVALADPDNAEAIAALSFAAGADEVQTVVSTFSDIEEAIITAFPNDESLTAADFVHEGSAEDLERLAESDSDAPVIRLVQRLLANAVTRRASDVHIEPMARHLVVRYRIDGRLVEVERHNDALAGPIALRIKVMAGLDIAESRLPQDGRLRLTVKGRDVDVRVSTSPIAYGESIVLRLLGRSSLPLELDGLGLPPQALGRLEKALERPHGIILLTGPTGSGKTTTLYAAINRLRAPDVKILTVEDPVEVVLEGINQVQVRPEIDLTYANALRAFLRQDPDILMIGEIRDRETADIAMRAALTGHLVLSTLHTNSAIGAFTRLSDIGIEPFLTASTVIATIAQRLVRGLCPECCIGRAPTQEEIAIFKGAHMDPPDAVFEPAGCPSCLGSGYKGRLPLMEIFEVGDDARKAIRAEEAESLEAGRPIQETLLGHGLTLIAQGRTDFSEVQRAAQLA